MISSRIWPTRGKTTVTVVIDQNIAKGLAVLARIIARKYLVQELDGAAAFEPKPSRTTSLMTIPKYPERTARDE
jgi:hypothetical protein